MKWLSNNPFLALAILTILVGAAYHFAGLNRSAPPDSPLHSAIAIIGFVFITTTRVTHSVIQTPALAGLVALPIALVPYVFADWLLRRYRASRTGA